MWPRSFLYVFDQKFRILERSKKIRSKNYFQDFQKNFVENFKNFLNWPQITSQNQLQANNPNNNATSLSLFMTKTFFPKFSLFGHVDVDLFSVWINFPKSLKLEKMSKSSSMTQIDQNNNFNKSISDWFFYKMRWFHWLRRILNKHHFENCFFFRKKKLFCHY